jgi:branched-chain amino acid transport system permease protein
MKKSNRLSKLGPLQFLGLAAVVFVLGGPYIIPVMISDFWVNILAEIFIWSLFAASVNFLWGYAGLLSFGQAVYFGTGAYGVALGIELLGLSFWPAFFFGIVIATVTAIIIGVFAVRLTWHYFAIITVVFCLIFFFVAVGWKDITGGDDGLPFSVPPLLKVGGVEITLFNLTFQYYFILATVGLCFWLFYVVLKSPLGQAIVAVRENADRASLIGFSTYKLRYVAFVISGFFAGVAGVLFALFARYASAHYLFWHLSGEGVIWTVVGGTGTLFGPVLGTALLVVVREELSVYWENYLLVVGVIIILVCTFAPQGIMGLLRKWLGVTGEAPGGSPRGHENLSVKEEEGPYERTDSSG